MATYLNPQTQWLTTAAIGDTFRGVTLVSVEDHGPFLAITLTGHGQTWTTDYPGTLRGAPDMPAPYVGPATT